MSDAATLGEHVRAANSSFYLAMRLLPRQRREAIFAVYAFCRAVDDIADDERIGDDDKLARLADWREAIDGLYERGESEGLCAALAPAVERYGLSRQDLIAVIDGMEMDVGEPMVAPQWATLDLYCDRVACAVGRLCVAIFGEPGKAGIALAGHLGRALQLTNIVRDVGEDARLGRVYLPGPVLARHGVNPYPPTSILAQQGYPAAWREVAAVAADSFAKADAALGGLNRRKVRPARIMAEVYSLNLKRMQALDDDALRNPTVSKRRVSKMEKLLIALRHGLM